MPAPLSPRNGYFWVNVDVRYAGIYIPCNSFSFSRDVEDSFVQTADVHGTSLHYYMANMDGIATLEVPLQQKLAVDFLGGLASAVDIARMAGGNPGTANPPVAFFMYDPSTGSSVASGSARVAGHPSDITFDESGEKMRTFKILCPMSIVISKGYKAAV